MEIFYSLGWEWLTPPLLLGSCSSAVEPPLMYQSIATRYYQLQLSFRVSEVQVLAQRLHLILEEPQPSAHEPHVNMLQFLQCYGQLQASRLQEIIRRLGVQVTVNCSPFQLVGVPLFHVLWEGPLNELANVLSGSRWNDWKWVVRPCHPRRMLTPESSPSDIVVVAVNLLNLSTHSDR